MKQMAGGDCGKSLSPRWELENFHKGRGGQGRPWCPWLISMAVWPHCPPRNSGRDRPGLLSAAYKPWTGLRQLCTPFGHQKRHHHGWRLNVPEKKTRRRGWSSQEPSEAPSSLRYKPNTLPPRIFCSHRGTACALLLGEQESSHYSWRKKKGQRWHKLPLLIRW